MARLDELFGGQEIIGAVDGGKGAIMPMGMRNPRLVNTQGGPFRKTPLGIDSGVAVAAGAVAVITVAPQVIYKPERFTVGGAIADFFLVNDIKVGNQSMLPTSDPVPAAVFAPDATESTIDFKTASVGNTITVTVENIDAAAHRFVGAFYGVSREA